MELTAERRELLREWGRKGGKSRSQQASFRAHQSAAGKRSAEVNDMAALGRKGARVYVAKYGMDKLLAKVRKWRIEHPSQPERQVICILNSLGFTYTREVEVLNYSVDFLLPNHLIIEVNGKPHYDPLFDESGQRQAKEAERLSQLESAGYHVLVLDHREMDGAKEKIALWSSAWFTQAELPF